ncbi:MAG TPA: MFS transporter, partial [Xanthobacteraceae bacterium]|nr:MFS transporter [Xanthobacteraceae bacterium]
MNVSTNLRARAHVEPVPAKTVQEYIDELPVWSDGTTLKSTPMTGMQWRIWALAASGKFFEGFVVFMGGVTVPLITREFALSAGEAGLVTSASLAGILVDTILLGGLSDYFGRKLMFIAEMIIFCLFLALLIMVGGFLSLVICLFGIGMALGCDYPTAHMIISESIPSSARGKLVLGAFAFQAVGALGGTAVGYAVLSTLPEISAWRWMYASAIIPAVLVTIGRFYIVESANWLSTRGKIDEAEKAVKKLLVRKPQYPAEIKLATRDGQATGEHQSGTSYAALFNKTNRRATILASVPWFLQDLGTYGI